VNGWQVTWVEKSGRNDEAGAEITALLGMDREQFTRVVMLPQGDFAAFLRSKASDRLDLLQKLFGTERFEAVERELSRQAQAAKEKVAVLSGQLELLAARAESEAATLQLEEAERPSRDILAADNLDADTMAGRLEWLKEGAAERRHELAELALAAGSASQERIRAVEAETALRGRHRRLEEATTRQAAVQAALPRLEDLSRRLGRHRQAEVLAGQLRSVDAAAVKVRRAADAMESAFTLLGLAAGEDPELGQLELGPAHHATLDVDGPALVPGAANELNRLRSLLAVVEARLPDEDRLKMLRSKHQQLTAKTA
jgi:exonuclease SbcC